MMEGLGPFHSFGERFMVNKKLLGLCAVLVVVGATAAVGFATGVFLRPDPEEMELRRANIYASTGSCGVERWSVKTGTDPDVHLVNLASPTSQTISYLRSLTAPSTLPANNRVAPTETTAFMVDATLIEYKLETDSDYHLVIKDAAGNTMIAEISDPACVGSTSPFRAYVQNARSEFDAKYTATTSFKTVSIPVRLFGVGFFDFQHGQTGVAPNAIELHPILDIVFNPTTGNQPPTANFSYTANGLVANFTDSSSDSDGTIASRAWTFGDGSTSTATNPSHTYATSGTYSVSLKVTDNGGATNTKTTSVTVSVSNALPVANFSYIASGLAVNFTDTSTDSDGTIASRAWTFGDGSTSTATNPSHTYGAAGSYSVALKVTDNAGGTNTKTTSVAVSGSGGSSQLLGNTGFETGVATPWTISTGVLNNSSTEPTHAGSWDAWMDGYGSAHTDTVSQSVAIPAGKTSATLAYWLHVDTAETSTTSAYDTIKVQVFNSSGTLLGTVAQYSNLDAATGYKQHTADLKAYIGQTITLKFIGTEDSTLQTSFVLDDVTLTVQ
jgi:PKD repeat protein